MATLVGSNNRNNSSNSNTPNFEIRIGRGSNSSSSSSSNSNSSSRSSWGERQERNERRSEGGGRSTWSPSNPDRDRNSSSSSWVRPKKSETERHRSETSTSREDNRSFALVDRTYNGKKNNVSQKTPKSNRTLLGGDKEEDDLIAGDVLTKKARTYNEQFSPLDHSERQKSFLEKNQNKGGMSYAAPIKNAITGEYDQHQANSYVQGIVARDFYDRETRANALNMAGGIATGLVGGIGGGAVKAITKGVGDLALNNAGDLVNSLHDSDNYKALPDNLKGLYKAHYQKLEKSVDESDDFSSSWGNAARSAIGTAVDVLSGGLTMGSGISMAKMINRNEAILDELAKTGHPEAHAILSERKAKIAEAMERDRERQKGERTGSVGILSHMKNGLKRNETYPELKSDYGIPDLSYLWANYKVERFKQVK